MGMRCTPVGRLMFGAWPALLTGEVEGGKRCQQGRFPLQLFHAPFAVTLRREWRNSRPVGAGKPRRARWRKGEGPIGVKSCRFLMLQTLLKQLFALRLLFFLKLLVGPPTKGCRKTWRPAALKGRRGKRWTPLNKVRPRHGCREKNKPPPGGNSRKEYGNKYKHIGDEQRPSALGILHCIG